MLPAVRRAITIAALLLGAASLVAPAAGAGDHVVRLRLTGEIDQITATYIGEGIKTAGDTGAAAVLIEIDSPGGELTSMDSILEAILGSKVPVITWVAPEGARAGSAATFVTLAGDVAAMAPSTNIGAASVIDSSGQDLPTTLGKKVTNDAVARITELAKNHGRNQIWAESAVRNASSASVTQAVSMEPPIVDFEAADTSALFAGIDLGKRSDGYAYTFHGAPLPKLSGLPIIDADMNPGQQFLQLLTDPNVNFILFTIGFYGLLIELFHPNLISGTLGAIAILLAFIGSSSLPLNVGGLLLILVGIGLFVLDVHVTSHGVLTLGGIACFVFGAFALYTGVNVNNPVHVGVNPILVGGAIALSLAYFWVLIRGLLQMRARRSTTLPIAALVGVGGTAQTLISPTGIAYAGGEAWSARSLGGEIRPGRPLRVVAVEGLELIVEPEEKDG
jgi:membrane-bound serine protease (ClpP class)